MKISIVSILSSIFVIFCIFAMTSCGGSKMSKLGEKMNDDEIKGLVKELNENCPVDYITFNAINFKSDDKNLEVFYTVNEDILRLDKCDQQTVYDTWRMHCIDGASDKDKALIKTLILSGYGMKCNFTGSKSNKKVSFEVSNEQLKNNKPLIQEELINNLVALTKSTFPKAVDQITQIIDFKIEKDKLIYVYEIDESNFDISKIGSDENYRENGILVIGNELRNNNLTGVLYKSVIRSGRGICHHYIGKNTGKTVDIDFSNIELEQIAKYNNVKLE